MKKRITQLLGFLVMVRVLIPIVLVGMFLFASYHLTQKVKEVYTNTTKKMDAHLLTIEQETDKFKEEINRIRKEIDETKGSVEKFAGEIERAITPVKKALMGVQGAVKVVVGGIAVVINGLISAINHIPFVDIAKISLKNLATIKIINFNIPDINFDLDPNLESIEALKATLDQMLIDAEQAVTEIKTLLAYWSKFLLVMFVLVLIWLALKLIGYTLRAYDTFQKSIRMMRGEEVYDGWRLL